MRYRMVRATTTPLTADRCYRVETEELLTAKEAMALMEALGSPYGARRPAPPAPTPAEDGLDHFTKESWAALLDAVDPPARPEDFGEWESVELTCAPLTEAERNLYDECLEMDDDWACTREPGHGGNHRATVEGGYVMHEWRTR